MKVELKNIKRAAFASQETDCFQATVYVDGKRAGTVSNEGFGGCNSYHPHTLGEAIRNHAKALPPINTPYGMLAMDADLLIGQLLQQHLEIKEHKRLCKKGTLVRFDGVEYGESEWALFSTPYSDGVIAQIESLVGVRVRECMNQQIGG